MDVESQIRSAPPILRHMVRMLLALDDRQQAAIAGIGEHGCIEIHWARETISIVPRTRLVNCKRESLEAELS